MAANERGPVRARRAWGPAHVAVSTLLLVARSAHMQKEKRVKKAEKALENKVCMLAVLGVVLCADLM